MNLPTSSRFLSFVLWADAGSCAAIAALHLAATPWLAQRLGLSPLLLVATGCLLLPVVLLAGALARSAMPPRAALGLLVAGNWAWVAGALLLLFGGAAGTPLGQAYLVLQAVAVAVLAELEWLGLRRRPGARIA